MERKLTVVRAECIQREAKLEEEEKKMFSNDDGMKGTEEKENINSDNNDKNKVTIEDLKMSATTKIVDEQGIEKEVQNIDQTKDSEWFKQEQEVTSDQQNTDLNEKEIKDEGHFETENVEELLNESVDKDKYA